MDKNYLLETARQLEQVSAAHAGEYVHKSDELITKMNTLMSERPDLVSMIGADNISMMKDNHANHVRFIASILKNFNPDVLVETVLWVFRAYRSHGFTTNYWAAQLNTWIIILKEKLSPAAFAEIFPYYEWMQINIPVFVKLSDEKFESPNSLH
ncbi:MAG: hypothetical protein JXJ22_14270 [Bacteroidales bacterium]|nr:hypothetical protein [Bacteroidales bacterium]